MGSAQGESRFGDAMRITSGLVRPYRRPVAVHISPWPLPCPSRGNPRVVKEDEAPHLWNALTEAMGLDPCAVLACFSDLGLSDTEIARYFGVGPGDLDWLRTRQPVTVPVTGPANTPK